MKIMIGSAGRRAYLVRWFQEAFARLNVDGTVIVTDASSSAPAASFADVFAQMPEYSDRTYAVAMLKLVERLQPDLVFSVNDYELKLLADGMNDRLKSEMTHVVSLSSESHRLVHDKLEMASFLARQGVATPRTALLTDSEGVAALRRKHERLIVKDRYGSGSNLVRLSTASDLPRTLAELEDALGEGFKPEGLIVQQMISGKEYGVDAVTSPVLGGSVQGVFARRKLSMRSGETDKAVTVDPVDFLPAARMIAESLGARGLIDMDMMLTEDGVAEVIDVNPRFGGGYPFVHAAGARVPDYYAATLLGIDPPSGWSKYAFGVTSAKYDDVAVTGGEFRSTATTQESESVHKC